VKRASELSDVISDNNGMEKTEFDYEIDEKMLQDYQEKSLELRLKWLFYGNKFRKHFPREIIEKQERFRDKRDGMEFD